MAIMLHTLKQRVLSLGAVDYFGILIFIGILLISGLFFLRQSQYVTVKMRLLDRNAPDFYYNKPNARYVEELAVGVKETDQVGRTVAEVTNISNYPSADVYHDVVVTLRLKAVYNDRTGKYSFSGSPLLIGEYREFNLQQLKLSGVIINIGAEEEEQQSFVVSAFLDPRDHQSGVSEEIEVTGVRNYLADQITPGLSIINGHGQDIATIIEVDKRQGTKREVSNGRVQEVIDPQTTQVYLELEVVGDKIGDHFYYKGESPLLINEQLRLVFDSFSISPTITDIHAK